MVWNGAQAEFPTVVTGASLSEIASETRSLSLFQACPTS